MSSLSGIVLISIPHSSIFRNTMKSGGLQKLRFGQRNESGVGEMGIEFEDHH